MLNINFNTMQKSEIKSDKPIFSGNFFLIQKKALPLNRIDHDLNKNKSEFIL